jgi:hypothetical protein
MTRFFLLAGAVLLSSCGPKTLTLPEEPVDRAATCGVVAAAEARAATVDVKADLPFDAMLRILHYTLLAGSTGDHFSSEAAASVQQRMTDLQDGIINGKWQPLVTECKAAFPATAVEAVKLPSDRFEAQLGCYELGDFIRSALDKQGGYDKDLQAYRDLGQKLDTTLSVAMPARAGSTAGAQQEERTKALAAMAKLGPPAAVMRECVAKFGGK